MKKLLMIMCLTSNILFSYGGWHGPSEYEECCEGMTEKEIEEQCEGLSKEPSHPKNS